MTRTFLYDIYRRMARTDLATLPIGLRRGKMGWCLFLTLYSELNGNSRARNLSSVLMSEALKDLRNIPAGIEDGTGGIIWILEYLKVNDLIETDDSLKRIYNMVMRDHIIKSASRPTHDLEDNFFTNGLYSLFSYKPAETATHYMNVENLIYLTDECERIMKTPLKGLYDPKQMPVSMLTSMVYFIKKIKEWNLYPFQTERLLRLVPELFDEIKVHNDTDDYAYHILMNEKACKLEKSPTTDEAASLLATLGFYSLI